MKQLLIPAMLILISLNIHAQEMPELGKSISVVGIAEQQVVPDEIYLQVRLKEYKRGNQKVSINMLEKNLISLVEKLGLPADHLTVENFYGANWNLKRRKNDDLLASKSFKLLVNSVAKLNDFIEMLDDQGVQAISISHYTHSEMDKLKSDLKVKAIKSAKKKADDMLSAIGEELGVALEVTEIEQDFLPQSKYIESKDYSNTVFLKSEDKYKSEIDFKTIQLKASIRVVFSIR
ncbi:MAG: SIMPL domain-containing protein [Bacteroidota bacterium]